MNKEKLLQELIDSLTHKNNDLKTQLNQHQEGTNSLLAQLDATKQMFNETLSNCLQLKTTVLLLQKHHADLNKVIADLQKQLETAHADKIPAPE